MNKPKTIRKFLERGDLKSIGIACTMILDNLEEGEEALVVRGYHKDPRCKLFVDLYWTTHEFPSEEVLKLFAKAYLAWREQDHEAKRLRRQANDNRKVSPQSELHKGVQA